MGKLILFLFTSLWMWIPPVCGACGRTNHYYLPDLFDTLRHVARLVS